jgi:hypothetical protein
MAKNNQKLLYMSLLFGNIKTPPSPPSELGEKKNIKNALVNLTLARKDRARAHSQTSGCDKTARTGLSLYKQRRKMSINKKTSSEN